MDHPARFALVEIENVHDAGLEFEPIHRVLFGVREDPVQALQAFYPGQVTVQSVTGQAEMIEEVRHSVAGQQRVGMINSNGFSVITLSHPTSQLAVGSLQAFLDFWMKPDRADQIDYVHGDEAVCELGARPGNIGFYLPGMAKDELFRTVILDGVLPRKTFSMGEAHEKRFYMESRKILSK